MNILKFKKIILAVLFIHLCGTSAIKAVAINAPVETYFLPEDIEEFNIQLTTLLDNAKDQVLVAMYWLTDEDIINKFISLKQKGIDIQIIFDESANNTENLIEKLMANDIIPYVLPKLNGSMHNKFLVIDGRMVLTGSANFTKTVLSKTDYYNNENVLILFSNKVAKKYRAAFFDIEKEIAKAYIELLADHWPNQLPDWLRYISLNLQKNDPNFANLLKKLYSNYNPTEQDRLIKFFPDIPLTAAQKREEPATPNQRAYLEARGVFEEGMSKQEASELIGQLQLISEPPVQQQKGRPVSDYQRTKLLEAGYKNRDIDEMSYDEAYEAIGQISSQRQQLPSHHVEREVPTQKQINLLLSKGFKKYQINNMSKKQASAAISKVLKGRRPY